MKKLCLVFNIQNCAEDYIAVSKFLELFYNDREKNSLPAELRGKVFFCFSEEVNSKEKIFSDIARGLKGKRLGQYEETNFDQDVKVDVYIRVAHEPGDATIEYIYLVALLYRFSECVCLLYLEGEQKEKYAVWNKAVDFFMGFSEKTCIYEGRIFGEYFSQKDKLWQIERIVYKKNLSNHSKISPVITLDENKEKLTFWRSSIVQHESDKIGSKEKYNQIIVRCKRNFIEDYKRKSDKRKRYYNDIFESDLFRENVKDMPLLAFYLFCVQMYYSKRGEILDENNIKKIRLTAWDIAEGILQLVENICHTTRKVGFLDIRVHEAAVEKKYLSERYGISPSKGEFYYEVRLLDISEENIIENFQKKISCDSVMDKLSIADFFQKNHNGETDIFWEQYNKKEENLVHHYGLQVFASIVSANEGVFKVISSSNYQFKQNEVYTNIRTKENGSAGQVHMPGTEYLILLPLKAENHRIVTSVENDTEYQYDLDTAYEVKKYNFLESENLYLTDDYDTQEKKEGIIDKLAQHMYEWIHGCSKTINPEKRMVSLFSIKEGSKYSLEIFCKSIILCGILYQKRDNKEFYCILNNCQDNQILEIVRLFAIFYCKAPMTGFLEKNQIYLAGEDEEFLITGKNINSLYTITSKIMLVKGINKKTVDIMEYLLRQYGVAGENIDENNRKVKLVPFDMLELPDSDMTLFEKGVIKTLNADIQKYSLGCKINQTHMRIGSKLHMGEFFEAELLFHNNYYISRFAALVLKKLPLDIHKKLILVGYETYSELLIYKIMREILNIRRIDSQEYQVSYMIYEQRLGGKFRYMDKDCLQRDQELQFAIIIPINSTLTTHNKVRQSLEEELKAKNIQKEHIKVVANYALILIGPSNEGKSNEIGNAFWHRAERRRIETVLIPEGEPNIEYFVNVTTEWYKPLKCPYCFPDNYIQERPIIETDRTSIVPVQLLGMLESDLVRGSHLQIDKNNIDRVRALKESLIYRHVTRNGNHFLYYFRLENYFIQERNNIIQWLKQEKNKIKKESDRIVYDIIVSPLHYSDAGFLAEVNHYLFDNAALVLNFEVEKEFRQNVKTKYSNIIGLYYNLCQMNKKAWIRFHFVDDSIVSGRTFARAKNIFQSLLGSGSGNIQVDVFSDIVILLNRMSADSVMNLTGKGNSEHFHAYVNLNISSMRNHEDACTECKLVDNFMKLRDQAATNQQYKYWDNKIVQHRPIDVRFFDSNNSTLEQKERAYKRMFCYHEINECLARLGNGINNVDYVRKEMIRLLKEEKKDQMEWLISYIKILSRPFVVYRKSNREAIFQILLCLIEYVTNGLLRNKGNISRAYSEIREICIFLREEKEKEDNQICKLLLILMKRLSDLGSNYVLRKENILSILNVADSLLRSKEEKMEFRDRYVGIIKRSCCSSSDEIKSVFLEYLILFGEEYGHLSSEEEKEAFMQQKLFNLAMENTNFVWRVFFENTRVLADGISDMSKDIKRNPSGQRDQILQGYYYENFRYILYLYGFWNSTEKKLTQQGARVLEALVEFYDFLCDKNYHNNDAEVYYKEILKIIKAVANLEKCYLLYAAELGNVGTKHYCQIQENGEIEFWEEPGNNIEPQCLIADTCAVPYEVKTDDAVYTRTMIKYELCNSIDNSEKLIDTILLQMDFPAGVSRCQIMIRLKLIMLFHNKILGHLKQDFSNNMIQKWSVREYFNKQMRLQRATDHTDRDNLLKYFNQICELSESRLHGEKQLSEIRLERDRALFHMVINAYIARMNVQLLAKSNPEREPSRAAFKWVYCRQIKPLIASMHEIENFRILGENGEEGFSQSLLDEKVRLRQTEEGESLSFRRVGVIVAELILSAISHSGEKRCSDIYIYREGRNLVVLNYFRSRKSIDKIRQDIKYSVNRKKDGISLATIKGTINACYNLDDQNGVEIGADVKNKKKYFYVKLPILDIREDK